MPWSAGIRAVLLQYCYDVVEAFGIDSRVAACACAVCDEALRRDATLAQRHPPLALATAALLFAQKWSSVGVLQLRQLEALCTGVVQASDICSAERALFFALLGCELDVLRPERLPFAGRSTAASAFLHMATLGALRRALRARSRRHLPTRRAPRACAVAPDLDVARKGEAACRAATQAGESPDVRINECVRRLRLCAASPLGARVAMLSRADDFIPLAAPPALEDQSDAGGADAGAEEDAAVDHRRAVEKRRKRVQRVR